MPVEVSPLRFKEAEAFWANKVPMTPEEFRGLGSRARQRAFAVAGIDRLDLVSQVHEALAKAMRGEGALESFKREMLPLFEAEGGISRARLETIFRTNIQTAFMAGRYAQLMQGRFVTWWRYSAVNDSRTRPTHRALNGIVRHRDDPFWDVFFPPNGFNCRCSVFPTAKPDNPESGIPDMIEPVDSRTGQAGLPVRPWPDRGFDTNVGKDWLAGLTPRELEGGFKALPLPPLCPEGRDNFAADPCWEPLADIDPRHIRPFTAKDLLPGNLTQVAYINAFLEEFGLRFGQDKLITLPGVRFPLVISEKLFLDKGTNTYKVTKRGRERYLRLLARTIQDPFEIWQGHDVRADGRTVPVLKLIRLFSDGQGRIGGFAAFRLYGRQWSGSTMFPPNPENARAMLAYLERERLEIFGRGGVRLYREP